MPVSDLKILQRTFLTNKVEKLNPRIAHCMPLRASLKDALDSFLVSHAGSILVLDDENVTQGIFTERDLLHKYNGRPLTSIKLSDIMTKPVQFVTPKSSIARLLHFITIAGFRHIPVLTEKGEPPRIISVRDVISFIYEHLTKKLTDPELMLYSDEEIVNKFFNAPLTILNPARALALNENASVSQALSIFRAHKVGSVVLNTSKSNVTGIFTERDFTLRVVAKELPLSTTHLKEVMTPNPKSLTPEAPVADVFSLMALGGFRHVPIITDKNELTGVLSVKNLIDSLTQSIIDELEHAHH